MAGQEKRSGGPRMAIETNDAAASGSSQANPARAPKPAVEAAPTATAEPSRQATASKPAAPKPKVKVQQPPQAEPAPQPQPQPAPQSASQPAPQPQPAPQQTASEEPRQEPTVAQQAAGAEAASSDPASSGAVDKQPQKPRMTFSEWVHKTFPGHENAFYGAMLALLVAALVFIIGVWRTLLLVVLVVVGIAIGQVFDGNPKIINAIRGLFESDRTK